MWAFNAVVYVPGNSLTLDLIVTMPRSQFDRCNEYII